MSVSLTLPDEGRNLEIFDALNSDHARAAYSRWSTASSAEETIESASSQSDKSDLQDLVASILRESPASPRSSREDSVKSLSWQQLAQRQLPKPYRTPTHSYAANRNGNQEKQNTQQFSDFRNDNFTSPMKNNYALPRKIQSPNGPKYNSDLFGLQNNSANVLSQRSFNETQLSNNDAAQIFLNSVRQRTKNPELINQGAADVNELDGDTFHKLIAMATDGLQDFVYDKKIQPPSAANGDKTEGVQQYAKLTDSMAEEFTRYRQAILQNNLRSPGALYPLQQDIHHQSQHQTKLPYPMQFHPNTPVQQQLLASQQRHVLQNTLQNSIAQEQMIQAKFRELGIGNGTPPPCQQINWAMANQSPDILQLRSLDPSKQLNTPKKMIHPGMNNVTAYNQSPSVGDHIPTLDGSHAFQPPKVQQDSKFLFRHMDSPWSEPTTPSTDTGIASCNSAAGILSPASLDTDKFGREVSPPFRPISSQGTLSSPSENEKSDEQDAGYQSGSKKTQMHSQEPSDVQLLLNPANTGSKNTAGGFAAPGYPVSFANTLSPFPRLNLPHNINLTRPVICSPNSSLSYSPLPRTFVPFLTEKGWVMMPADQVGSPMPPSAKAGESVSHAEWLKMQRNVPRYKLYLCMDECFEQVKALERERRMAESELAQHFPGRRVTGCNNTPLPRLPANPSKADKLIVDQLREHSRVMTLIDRMEHLIEGPLHANIAGCLERHYQALKEVEAKRRDEMNSKHATPASPSTHQDGDNDDITKALADSLERLVVTTRKSRTAVWCALQVTIAANKIGDMDFEVALAMNAITENGKNVAADADAGCRKDNARQPRMVAVMELYEELATKTAQ